MEDETKPDSSKGVEAKLIITEVKGSDGQQFKYGFPPETKGHIQFDEVWTATIEKIGDELIEKLITRMKEEAFTRWRLLKTATADSDEAATRAYDERFIDFLTEARDEQLIERLLTCMEEKGFAKVHDPDYIKKAIDSLYPPGVIAGPTEPCPEGFLELETGGKPICEWVEIEVKPGHNLKEAATENAELQNMLTQAQMHRGGLSDLAMNAWEDSIREGHKVLELMREEARKEACVPEPTPPYIKDMYKMPSDDVPIPRMTPEQREQLYKKPDGYFDENDFIKEANNRSNKTKTDLSEFEKSDWQCAKEAFAREWKAAKQLFNNWRNK